MTSYTLDATENVRMDEIYQHAFRYANACAAMRALLANNWTKGNTDRITPIFINGQDEKDPNATKRDDVANADVVRIYEYAPENRETNGIGTTGFRRDNYVTIDVKSGISQAHAVKLKGETLRILETNLVKPATGYDYIIPPIKAEPFSGVKYMRLWRWTIEINLVNTNTAPGT